MTNKIIIISSITPELNCWQFLILKMESTVRSFKLLMNFRVDAHGKDWRPHNCVKIKMGLLYAKWRQWLFLFVCRELFTLRTNLMNRYKFHRLTQNNQKSDHSQVLKKFDRYPSLSFAKTPQNKAGWMKHKSEPSPI